MKNDIFRLTLPGIAPLLILFILTRTVGLLDFPPFNDESIYIQYAQLINQDWNSYKFISLNNAFGDWKPPLIYWLCSVSVGIFDNPLLAARLTSSCISVIGFLSIYALAGYFFNSNRTAFWAGLFWIMNPMALFYDRVFTAETFVYSFMAATLLFSYLSVERNGLNAVAATVFGALSLLSKQSGQLILLDILFLTILCITIGTNGSKIVINYRKIFLPILVTISSYSIYRVVIPTQYLAKNHEWASGFTFSPSELLTFPISQWLVNIKSIFTLYYSYYSFLSVVMLLVFIIFYSKTKNKKYFLLLMWLFTNSTIVVVYFKHFNEYVYNTACLIFIALILGRVVVEIAQLTECSVSRTYRIFLRHSTAFLLLSAWIYSFAYYFSAPVTYIQNFGTSWMKQNYLEGWPSGFGIPEVLQLMSQEQNKFVFVDPQWGNPGAGIEVFSKHHPTLKLVKLNRNVIPLIDKLDPNTAMLIFRYRPDRGDNFLVNLKICQNPAVIQVTPTQLPIYVCRN